MLLNRNIRFISITLIVFSLLSCDSKRFFEENKSIEKGVWNRTVRIPFTMNIVDSLARYNLFLNIRNDGVYPFSNLLLICAFCNSDEAAMLLYDGGIILAMFYKSK